MKKNSFNEDPEFQIFEAANGQAYLAATPIYVNGKGWQIRTYEYVTDSFYYKSI